MLCFQSFLSLGTSTYIQLLIIGNVVYSTFTIVVYSPHFLRFLTFFQFFLLRLFKSIVPMTKHGTASACSVQYNHFPLFLYMPSYIHHFTFLYVQI